MSSKDTSELPRAVQNGMSQAEYDTWLFLSDKKALDEPFTFAIKQSDLTKFLAAQKQRWEAEARKDEVYKAYNEVVGEPSVPLRSKFVKVFTKYLKNRIAALDGVIGEPQ